MCAFYFCFLCVFFVCLCVCYVAFFMLFFLVGRVGIVLTGGGCVVPCSCTKDKNSLKNVLFAIQVQKYGSSFLITRVYCGFRHTQKTHVSRPHPCPKITPHLFFIYILFSNFPPENGANKFLGTRSDILYRLIRKNVAHSCTGDMWSQII